MVSGTVSPAEMTYFELKKVDPDARPTMSDLYENAWVIASDGPLKSRCSQYVEVTEDDINSSVTVVPKLETLIMVKQMLKRNVVNSPKILIIRREDCFREVDKLTQKRHSFRNPFLSKKTE